MAGYCSTTHPTTPAATTGAACSSWKRRNSGVSPVATNGVTIALGMNSGPSQIVSVRPSQYVPNNAAPNHAERVVDELQQGQRLPVPDGAPATG
jgi:hypothetical protein